MYGLPDFTVGGALRQTADLVKRHGGTLLALSMLFYALLLAVLAALPPLGLAPSTTAMRASVAAGDAPQMSGAIALMAFGFASLAVTFAASLVSSSAQIWVAHEGLHGRPASVGGGAARAAGALLPALGMTVVYGLGASLASILLVVPGIMLFVRWSAALPAVVVERAGVLGSLGRSRDLTAGHRWAVFGFLLVLFLFNAVAFVVVRFGGGALAVAVGGGAGAALVQTASFVANAIVSTVSGAGTAAAYFELRRAGEGVLSSETAAAFS